MKALARWVVIFVSLFVAASVPAQDWVITEVDSGVGYYASIAVDDYSQPHIAYTSYVFSPSYVKYARRDSLGWIIETIDTMGSVTSASLVLDENDNPHIAYCREDNGTLNHAER